MDKQMEAAIPESEDLLVGQISYEELISELRF